MGKVTEDHGSVGMGALRMVGLSILLLWIPMLGPLIAGFVGGRKAGGIGGASTK